MLEILVLVCERDSEKSLIQLKSYNKHSIQYHTIFKMRVFLAAVLLLCASAGTLALPRRLNGKDGGNIYALLVAGSNTWMNYRHQVFNLFVCLSVIMLDVLSPTALL